MLKGSPCKLLEMQKLEKLVNSVWFRDTELQQWVRIHWRERSKALTRAAASSGNPDHHTIPFPHWKLQSSFINTIFESLDQAESPIWTLPIFFIFLFLTASDLWKCFLGSHVSFCKGTRNYQNVASANWMPGRKPSNIYTQLTYVSLTCVELELTTDSVH